MELRSRPFLRRSVCDIPGRGRVDGEHGDRGVFHGSDDGFEGVADSAGKGEAWIVLLDM